MEVSKQEKRKIGGWALFLIAAIAIIPKLIEFRDSLDFSVNTLFFIGIGLIIASAYLFEVA